ncbi:endonuclease VII [Mycobacterium phage Omega]|uniref:Endonuclease VII n=1 Tax=Mycobacterium phage Omega TaxID=2907835 RepID=Q854C9_BPMOM|nr:endonuclease VII [Mycobacterium phage Omega]AAN12779.1 hypothetical protein PBI_OMEGA_138 [Mycobacterium phage Omega]
MSDAAKGNPGYRSRDRQHKRKPCVDCVAEGITTNRPADYPGPRCWSHDKAKKRERKAKARARRWDSIYGITPDEYAAILEEQGGRCALCQRANGTTKALAVEHDHKTGVVRGICCGPCNLGVLGHARDDIAFFERAIDYLNSPPAVRAIGIRVVPDHIEE